MRSILLAIIGGLALGSAGCGGCDQKVKSASGVDIAKVGPIKTDGNGHTIEQRNVIERISKDNDLGTIKHLYVISAYSGQVILYSPVRGKVTSGGKSLTPKKIQGYDSSGLPIIDVAGAKYRTDELPGEDGTYGHGSADYIYWFSPDGSYHQHFLSGGQIVHISDRPVTVKGVIINLSVESKKE